MLAYSKDEEKLRTEIIKKLIYRHHFEEDDPRLSADTLELCELIDSLEARKAPFKGE